MKAKQAFQFVTASYLVQISGREAGSLEELQQGIERCSDASMFYHTFQSLARHHFLHEGFSNDFAQWVLGSCNLPALAERLVSLDLRDYVSVGDLRADLIRVLSGYCRANPQEAKQSGHEKFYFCETVEEELPLGEAWTLEEFRDRLKELPGASLQFHFLTSRLRLHLRTNDFSHWFAQDLGLEGLARSVDRIDVYAHTLDSARDRIVELVEMEMS